MNDLILQEKVLKNKNLLGRFQLYTLPIGWTLGLLVTKFTIQFVNHDFAAAPEVARQFAIFTYLIMAGSTFTLFYGSLYMVKIFNAIQVTESGVNILGPFHKEQNVRWDEIKAIEKSVSQKKNLLQKESSLYKVQTTIPGKFSLRKNRKFFFYITSNHESQKELVALLTEKTGLKVDKPPRKPNIPTWKPGSTR